MALRVRRLWAIACLTAFMAVTVSAPAQIRRIEGGNVLDANPAIGSGGTSPYAPPPPINRAQLLMTGNVSSGAAFRGFSPIRDPSQFTINLPSAGLSGFRADSVSVADVMSGATNYRPRPYFDPYSTYTNVGGIGRGLNLPGSSVPRSTHTIPREEYGPQLRPSAAYQALGGRQPYDAGLAVQPSVQRSAAGLLAAGGATGVNDRLLASPLFAGTYDVPLPELRRWAEYRPGHTRRDSAGAVVPDRAPLEVIERSSQTGAIVSPLERLLGTQPPAMPRPDYRISAELAPGGTGAPIQAEPALARAVTPSTGAEPQAQPIVAAQPEWLGQDRFRDMAAAWHAARRRFLGEQTAYDSISEASREDAGSLEQNPTWVRAYVSAPITTFVGSSATTVNEYLAKAEAALREGRYYRGASYYDMAATVDPDSPLPLLGRAQALIAAGEYMTAANLLSRAVEKFPGIAYFRIDLKAFIPDPVVLERRRADLERLLQQNDDYRLRFVLGYLEYSSGLPIPGLENLVKAAARAPAGSPIAAFPDLLKQRMSLPLEPKQ